LKTDFSVLILAAGEGTRMKSALPKVLHPVSGVPMLLKVLDTVRGLRPKSVGIVAGSGADEVKKAVGSFPGLTWILQKERKGSGHAVKQASSWIRRGASSAPHLMVLCGDAPLIKAETLRALHEAHLKAGNAATALSAKVANPLGYGRIEKDDFGRVKRIVEEKDASPAQRGIREVNSGVYFFDAAKLLQALTELKNDNAKKEFYLTDVIEILDKKGFKAASVVSANGIGETVGINSRADLAAAQGQDQQDILAGWMKEGVTVFSPATTYVDARARIGKDSVLLPGTMIMGSTVIGEGSTIGPNAYIEDSKIGGGCTVRASFVYGATVEDDVNIGPFTHIRQGSLVKKGARVGNFSEVKKSVLGKGAKVSHLSYVGDAEIGDDVNVGAGVITCNFDGVNKHKTVIGRKTFVGSNVNLVAPVTVGEGSVIGAGSTITENVPAHSLALARPFQIVKKNWVKNKKRKKS